MAVNIAFRSGPYMASFAGHGPDLIKRPASLTLRRGFGVCV